MPSRADAPEPLPPDDAQSWFAEPALELLDDFPVQTSTAAQPTHSGGRDDLKIPDYDLIKRIGSGAYGEVWLAQGVTGALRAVKIVWREDFELTKTFHREFQGIQQFEPISRGHPGLVDVLHVGWNEERGYYYYVMELADDCEEGPHITDVGTYTPRTLSTDMRRHGRLDLHFCQEAGSFMADALHYIHQHGLTHRDIKPSNIIYCGGVCKIADIGLVAVSGERSFVGTEGFVPPEGPGTPQADIYSLGKVLYEMSTGKDRMEFPEVPERLDASELPFWKNFNQVICQACAPSLEERFATGEVFADALRAVTERKPLTPLGRGLHHIFTALLFLLSTMLAGAVWSAALHQQHWAYTLPAPTKPPPQLVQPSKGKPWQSSTGLWFSYAKDRHLADAPVDFPRFNQFLESTMRPFEGEVAPIPTANGKTVAAVVVPAADAEEYCLWLTQRERRAGRMTEQQEFSWARIPQPNAPADVAERTPWFAIRLEVAKATYGRMVITSLPSPAQVYDGDTLLGTTPLTLPKVNSGLYHYDIHYPGYKWETLKGTLKEGESRSQHVRLKNINAVVWDKPWVNSQKATLVPLGRVLMAATEVTRSQYAEYLSERKLSALPEQRLEVKEEQKLPITHITYAEAQAFCTWLTEKEQAVELIGAEEQYRLPLDDEWSMAAGLPRELGTVPAESHLRTRGFYPWGFDQEVMNANVGTLTDGKAKDSFPLLSPVGSFKANARNLFDLSGNVWEWVEEAYGGEDASSRDSGTARGGSWRTTQLEQLLSSYRMAISRDGRRDDVGFRIVLTRGQPARADE